MFKRRHFLKWRRFYLLTGVFFLFGLAFSFWNLSSKNPTIFRIVEYVSSIKVSKILDYTFLPINDYFNQWVNAPKTFDKVDFLNQELRNLKQELFYKERELSTLKQVVAENSYLKSLLNYASNISYTTVPARVISYEPQNHFTFFWVNAGIEKGIKENMPVVGFNTEGKESLVGYIETSTDKSSMVRTILDPQTHVGVIIPAYESRGILRGDNQLNQLLSVDYINGSLTNLNNLSVETSGIGERYPTGIFVGTILEEFSSVYGLFKKASIKPAIDFYSIKDVFIIKNISQTN